MYNTYIRKVAVSMKNDEKIDIVLDEISEEELSAEEIRELNYETAMRYMGIAEHMKQYEEHVRMSRMIYNDTATKMNRMVRQWPSSIVASMLHFDQKEYLKVDDEKKKNYPDLDEAFKK